MLGTIELKELPGLTRTEAIGNLERELHSNMKNVTANQIDILIRNLAQARLEAAFGIVYAGIFGSQIVGLNELAARRRVAASEAYSFHQEAEKVSGDLRRVRFCRQYLKLLTSNFDDKVAYAIAGHS